MEKRTHKIGDTNVNIVADGRYITIAQSHDVIALSIDEAREMAAVIDEVGKQTILWSNCETGTAEKRARIVTGLTRIRQTDGHGTERTGIVHSFEYGDDEHVIVMDIAPPQATSHNRTIGKWALIESDIEVEA